MLERDNILIGIPAYNESTQIEEVIDQLHLAGFSSIVIVDDGSTDETQALAFRRGARVLRHEINCGAGAGVQTLMLLAKKENWPFLLLMDADGQHHPEDIDRLYAKMNKTRADLVIGNRFDPSLTNQVPRIRRIFNSLANILTNLFCKGAYGDSQSGFRLLNSKAIEKIELSAIGFGFCSEMILLAEKEGLEVHETPIHVKYTNYSMSKGQRNIWNGIRTAWQFLENI